MSPHHETVTAGTLCALPLLYFLCWRCTFLFFSFRQGFIGAPAAVEGNENKQQGSVAAPLPEGGAGLFRIESGWEEGTFFNRTKDKRENRGLWGARPGYLPLAPPGLLPIPLRGSGPRRLSWEGGAEARMDFGGPETEGAQAARPGPAPSGSPSRARCRLTERHRGRLASALSAQPSLPQAPSSQARK